MPQTMFWPHMVHLPKMPMKLKLQQLKFRLLSAVPSPRHKHQLKLQKPALEPTTPTPLHSPPPLPASLPPTPFPTSPPKQLRRHLHLLRPHPGLNSSFQNRGFQHLDLGLGFSIPRLQIANMLRQRLQHRSQLLDFLSSGSFHVFGIGGVESVGRDAGLRGS